jgi:hydrogenase maturation protease
VPGAVRTGARLLVFGYGNPSRGDDALGPELIRLLEEEQGRRPGWARLTLLTDFQLQPEHALDLDGRDAVLFVDAAASGPQPYALTRLSAGRDASYTSHALSPAAVLHVREAILERPAVPAYLLAIRGYGFELGEPMSEPALANLAAAREALSDLLQLEDPMTRLEELAGRG